MDLCKYQVLHFDWMVTHSYCHQHHLASNSTVLQTGKSRPACKCHMVQIMYEGSHEKIIIQGLNGIPVCFNED